tara:strand:- start:21258 stop:21836 length:579 start_codon:yes stop_codon:yes gene_type:complete
MALWGVSDADEAKPKWLSDTDKSNTFASAAGWVLRKTVGSRTLEELLVAVGSSTGLATDIGQADITAIDWVSTEWDVSAGGTLSATVSYNEAVTVSGSPTLSVSNGNQGSGSGRGPHVLVYASGSTTNQLTFELAIGAGNAAIAADDVLSFGADAVAHAGGSTIVDTVGGGNATITSSAGIGTAAGTITAVA